MARNNRQRPQRHRTFSEASYDEASRSRRQIRNASSGRFFGPEGNPERIFVVLGAFALFVCLRLIWLQVVDAGNLSTKAAESHTNTVAIHAKRGTIYDRNGNVLAMSVDCKDIVADPQQVDDVTAMAKILVEVLGGDQATYEEKLSRDSRYALLASQVDDSVADELKSRLAEKDMIGIYYNSNTKRVYPYGSSCAQLIGYVNSDGTALSGLEYYYNETLTGTDGTKIYEAGAGGSPMASGASYVEEAKDGTDIVLSIDIDLQQEVEQIITDAIETYGSNSGSVMVTNPKTGEIYAACSTPMPDFSNITDVSSLNLKLVTDSYEPGSVFKILTTSIGIENGLFTPESVYTIPVSVKVGDDYVYDTDDARDYTMDMTVREMLRRSSNVAMSTLAQDVIGATTFAAGVDKFGIGHTTGIDFPGEAAGIVRPLSKYDGSTLGSMSFGQGLAIPMVQIVRAFAAVANDGVPNTPHFLVSKGGEEVSWPAGEQIISKETADQVTDMMRTVMQEGTGTNGQVEGYDIAGKTGTGEQASSEGYEEYNFVASLCGFANADNPEVLVYTGLNGTAHLASASAANVFHDVMQKAVTTLGIAPTQ